MTGDEGDLPEVVDPDHSGDLSEADGTAGLDLGALLGGIDMGAILGAAQSMQQQMVDAQEQLAETVVTGSAGAGLVSVDVTGDHRVLRVSISPEAVDPDDLSMLEDLLVAALRDANTRVVELQSSAAPFDLGDLGGFGGALGDPGPSND